MIEHDHDMLEAYLDGLLTGDELRLFETRVAADAELRSQVEAHRAMTASVKRLVPVREVALPAEAGFAPAQTEDAARFRIGSKPSRRRQWLAAAVLVLVAGAAAYLFMFSPQQAPMRQPHEVYQMLVQSGFTPAEVCTTEEEFTAWTRERHGIPLLIPADLSGVELVGWTYSQVLDYNTSVLMARVDGEPVIVLIDDAVKGLRMRAPSDTGLKIFRREIDGLILYEVSPLRKPKLIPHARIET